MTSTPAHLKGRKRNLSRRWEDCGNLNPQDMGAVSIERLRPFS
jgi:hypothetical protein